MDANALNVTCQLEEVTPETAKQWLDINHINRRLSDPQVHRLANIIRRGEWMADSTDAIGLDTDGGVINGQHRLTAIVEADRPIHCVVMRNVRPEVIKVIDQGRGRSFLQFLQMQGNIPNPTVVAPAVEWLYRINNGFEVSQPTALRATVPQLLGLFAEHPKITHSLNAGHEAYKRVGVPGKAMLTTYHYVMASVDSEQADDFFTGLATGIDLPDLSPVHALREKLLRENAKDTAKRPKAFVMCAWLVKAWEATREGLELTERQLTWKTGGRGGESFPKVSDVPWEMSEDAIEPDGEDDDSQDGFEFE